jgi:DNA-binding phage protein
MAKVKDLPLFDAAEALDTPERQEAYLRLAMAEGDENEIRDAQNLVARARQMMEAAKDGR